jgi:hypothetical protein
MIATLALLQVSTRGTATPRPTVTVTVQASTEPTPPAVTVTVAPEACAMLAHDVEIFYPALDEYNTLMGAVEAINNKGIQGMTQNSPKILNSARQDLIDLNNANTRSLIELNNIRQDILVHAAACGKDTP